LIFFLVEDLLSFKTSVNGSITNRPTISVGNVPTATVKVVSLVNPLILFLLSY
jgi:mediator of RNA polymerase II transcription subunit 25